MDSAIKAVLGPTNTGKTHLAIERMIAHSSGAMGFPLRLLAREVYDRVRAIKGDKAVALVTGEERIEPPGARYLCCTVEAMPQSSGDRAFVALDEAQLAADRERGHIFTDRLLNLRGREETMLLGAATLEPLVKALAPRAEIVTRPRFSTLKHIGARKLSRLPPRGSPNSTIRGATSIPCRAGSPRFAVGPISASGPTGCLPATRWRPAPARSRRACPTRCTRG
jgi:ATP-dependent RNA helicase SUPV3L1/SUV3